MGKVVFLFLSADRPLLGSFDFSLLCLVLDGLSDDLEDDDDDSDAERSECLS